MKSYKKEFLKVQATMMLLFYFVASLVAGSVIPSEWGHLTDAIVVGLILIGGLCGWAVVDNADHEIKQLQRELENNQ